MDRVYLDWNIIAKYRDYHFKNDESASSYGLIQEYLNQHSIGTYYSDAHLLDIQPLNHKSKYKDIDLKALSQITQDSYLSYFPMDNYWRFEKANPSERFDELEEERNLLIDFDSVLQQCGVLGEWVKYSLEKIAVPTYDPINNEDVPSNMFDYMKHITDENNKAMSDSKFYRKRRNEFVEQLQNLYPGKRMLSGSKGEKLLIFFVLYDSFMEVSPEVFDNRLAHIQVIFMLLDQVHLWTDSSLKNLQIDAMHAFYATHSLNRCLITNDKNMIMKSRLAFYILDITVYVMDFSDFLKILKET